MDHIGALVFHVVAQIVETKLVVSAVGYVGRICIPALLITNIWYDHTDRHAQELVDLAHPFGVATGEIIVNGDNVDAGIGQRI